MLPVPLLENALDIGPRCVLAAQGTSDVFYQGNFNTNGLKTSRLCTSSRSRSSFLLRLQAADSPNVVYQCTSAFLECIVSLSSTLRKRSCSGSIIANENLVGPGLPLELGMSLG